MTAHQNHQGNVSKHWCSNSSTRNSDFISLDRACHQTCESFPGEPDIQSGLGTTEINHFLHDIFKNLEGIFRGIQYADLSSNHFFMEHLVILTSVILQLKIKVNIKFRIKLSNFPKIFFFRAAPKAYGSCQARDRIGAAAPSLHHSPSNMGSERVCDLYHSSWQRWIPNSLSEARDQTCILMVTSQIRFHCTTMGTPQIYKRSKCAYQGRRK